MGKGYDGEVGLGRYHNGYLDVYYDKAWGGGQDHLKIGVVQVVVDGRRVVVYAREGGEVLVEGRSARWFGYYCREMGGSIRIRDIVVEYASSRYRPDTWRFCDVLLYPYVGEDRLEAYRNDLRCRGLIGHV